MTRWPDRRRDVDDDLGAVGVLMLTKGLGRGGTERLIAGTVRHLDPSRFRAEVAYLLPWKDALVGEIERGGIVVHCFAVRRSANVRWLRDLRRLVRERDIRIVHTHMPVPAVAARLVLGGRRGPTIVHTEHNLWARYRWPTRWANRLTYRRNRAVIAVSAGVAASIRSAVPVEVVLHGAESPPPGATRTDARATLGLPPDVPVIGCVGNFTAKKDHAGLLHAIHRVRVDHPSVRLVLVGLGPLEEELRRLVHQLGLTDHVVFAGSRGDVPEVLPGFDVFALGSQFEGLPIALLEAMGAGVASVATTVGGIPEVVTDDVDGLLVPPGDPGALAAAISRLLGDPATRDRIGRAGATRAAGFELSHAVERIEAIYDRVLVGC